MDICFVRTLVVAEFASRFGVDIKKGVSDLVVFDGNFIGVEGTTRLEV